MAKVTTFLVLIVILLSGTASYGGTTYGKFQNYISGQNKDAPLLRSNGIPILPSEVTQLYGTPDGMTLYEDGIDVCSWEYVAKEGLTRRIRPVYQDLSDAAGWPNIRVKPDTVAIDPVLGRFKLSGGGLSASKLAVLPGDSEVVLVWANPPSSAAGWSGTSIVRKPGGYPAGPTDGTVIYDGKGMSFIDVAVTNGTTYYYAAFAHDGAGNSYNTGAKAMATPQAGLPSPNLIQNGGFEAGDTNGDGVGDGWLTWALSNSSAIFSLNNATKYRGVFSQEMHLGPNASAGAFIGQRINLKPNTPYTLSLWGKTEGNSKIQITFQGSTKIISLGVFGQGFIRFTTPNSNGKTVSAFLKILTITPGTSVFVDQVLLVEVNTQQIPPIQIEGHAHTGFGVPGWGEIKVQGNYAYMASGEGDFQIIDITDKTRPFATSYFPVGFNAHLDVQGNYAYLRDFGGIITVDVSNPSSPQWPNGVEQHPNNRNLPWTPSGGGRSNEVRIRNGLAYVTVSGSSQAFYILDISDPTHLRELGSATVSDPKGAGRVFINNAGNLAYIGLASGGVAIIDISSPAVPGVLGSYVLEPGDNPQYDVPWLIGVSGSTMVMTIRKRFPNYPPSRAAKLLLVDASNPSQPYRRGVYSFGTDANPGNTFIYLRSAVAHGQYIYVSDQNENSFGSLDRLKNKTRLLTFDISNPDNPVLADEFVQQEPSRYQYLSIYGQYLYINDYNYGLRIFSLANPSVPRPVGGTVTAGEGHYAWVNDVGTTAYLSQTFGGSIYVIDVSNPASPVKRGTYWDGDWNEHAPFMGRGNYLYVPQRTDITIVDVSNPDVPVKSGVFPALAGTYDEQWPRISIFGDRAYVTTVQRGSVWGQYNKLLKIYDISSPASPLLISSLTLVTGSRKAQSPQLFAQGGYVYVVLGNEQILKIVNVNNPYLPWVEGELNDPVNLTFDPGYLGEMAGRIFVARGYAYISTGEWRTGRLFHIVDVSSPGNPVYAGIYDNSTVSGVLGRKRQGVATDIRVSGRFLYAGSYGAYYIYDISNPVSPEPVANSVYDAVNNLQSYQYGGIGLSGWSSGPVLGEYLYSSALNGLFVSKVFRDAQTLTGVVSANANISIPDTTPPVIAPLGSNPVTLEVGSIYQDAGASAFDNIDGDISSGITVSGSVNANMIGVYTLTYTVADSHGNVATATRTVNVVDTTAPVLTPPANVTAEANGVRSTVAIGTATATDIFPVTITNNAPATYPLGTTTVIWTATDANGNSSTAAQTVMVTDTMPPGIMAPPDVTIEATGNPNTPYTLLISAAATDLVGVVSTTSNAPASFPMGITVVTWTATDAAGNSATATQNVIVQDTTPPVLTVPANVTAEATGPQTSVAAGTATATDIFPVTVTSDAPATFPVGATVVVTWTATDANGNASTGTQNVTVADTTAPAITVPADVTTEANAVSSTVAIGTATAVDLVDGAVSVSNNAPATYPLGTTVVTYTATDVAGNTATATQNVTVADTTPPVLNVPANVSIEANAISSTVALRTATATDIFAVTVTSNAPATLGLGTTVVTWTATDANGNASTGTQNVTVVDTTAPVLTVPANVTVDATGMTTAVTLTPATATDIFAVTITNDAPSGGFPIGDTTVIWTATDANGNVSTVTQIVTVDAHLALINIGKAEVEWRELTDEQGQKYGMSEVKAKGKLALPVWMPLSSVAPVAAVGISLGGVSDLLAQNVSLTQKGDKWKYKLKTASGVEELSIKWKGSEFNFKDAASGVELGTESEDTTVTSLAIDPKGHAVTAVVNGVSMDINVSGAVTSAIPYDQDEDGEVTFELPFELTPAMHIQLTIDGIAQDILAADYYRAAQGEYELKAEVNAGSLTGAIRPAGMGISLSLGKLAMDGTANITTADWTKLSNKEWKLKH